MLVITQEPTLSAPEHHKQLVAHLRDRFPAAWRVMAYRDDYGKRLIHVGEFEQGKRLFYSTVGQCDKDFGMGRFEFAAFGNLKWLPNALVTSAYWLAERKIEEWPLVCEDAIRQNVKSPYRHMGYVPSVCELELKEGQLSVRWLLGLPLKDSEIGVSEEELFSRARALYPNWFFESLK